MAIKLRKLLHI